VERSDAPLSQGADALVLEPLDRHDWIFIDQRVRSRERLDKHAVYERPPRIKGGFRYGPRSPALCGPSCDRRLALLDALSHVIVGARDVQEFGGVTNDLS
jgi:hypothetical protein